jgi:hypothetical protein
MKGIDLVQSHHLPSARVIATVIRHYYLGDPAGVQQAMQTVANQASTKP